MNEAGADLLSSCTLNEMIIMNTCFEKKDTHKFTWQHPGSKQVALHCPCHHALEAEKVVSMLVWSDLQIAGLTTSSSARISQ